MIPSCYHTGHTLPTATFRPCLPPCSGRRPACRGGRHLAVRIQASNILPRQDWERGVRRAGRHGSTAGETPAATASEIPLYNRGDRARLFPEYFTDYAYSDCLL